MGGARRASSGKLIKGWRGSGGAEGLVRWGRKDNENFRVNMVWLVYPYTTTSPPLYSQGA